MQDIDEAKDVESLSIALARALSLNRWMYVQYRTLGLSLSIHKCMYVLKRMFSIMFHSIIT
jgi:hypothetical protein